MHRTKIDWCDYSWNPVTGCLHGCDYCYSRRIAQRFKRLFPNGFEPMFHPKRLLEPLEVSKPSRIFAISMGDLFGDWVPEAWIISVLDVIRLCDWHTFILLTKNPKRLLDYPFPPNAWIGVSCEDQRAANERIPLLLQASAAVRFVSCEPLLGPINFTRIEVGRAPGVVTYRDALKRGSYGTAWHELGQKRMRADLYASPGRVDWVIVGAETGPGAKPYKPEWVQRLIDQCREAGVPVFLKDNLRWPERIQKFPGDPLEDPRRLADEYKRRTGLDDDEAVEAAIKRAREI